MLVAVAVLVSAGCGSDPEPTSTSASGTSATPNVSVPDVPGSSVPKPGGGGGTPSAPPGSRVLAAVTPELCGQLGAILDTKLDGPDLQVTANDLAGNVDAALTDPPPGPKPSLEKLKPVTDELRSLVTSSQLRSPDGVAQWFSQLDGPTRDEYLKALKFLGLYHARNC